MEKQDNVHSLEQEWERAVQEARETSSQKQPLADETLGSAAGLKVKAHVRSGLYPTQGILSYCCTGHGCL